MIDYDKFLQQKHFRQLSYGFEPSDINPKLFDFQKAIVRIACMRGRLAIFADTGLGKSPMQCEWSRLVCEHTGGDVLIVAPLCVGLQTSMIAAQFGISVNFCRNQADVRPGINITNYEMLHHFDVHKFVGVVLDESSILKHQNSKTRHRVIELFARHQYKLSCTATPAPNDDMELGAQSEFLGVMTASEMMAMFFVHDGGETQKWRLKKHGESRFWEWMATWAVVVRNPSDIGFDGSRYVLPELKYHHHVVDIEEPMPGELFVKPAQTLSERRDAKRQSLDQRVAIAAKIANELDRPCIVWCHLNDESSALKKAIPDAVEVYGALDFDEKERRIMAFTNGEARVIVTKDSITGFGLNWQHCSDMIFVGVNDSYESLYQAIRRCYRFGQNRHVNIHMISTTVETHVMDNLQRKEGIANGMAARMAAHMRELTKKTLEDCVMIETEYKTNVESGDGWELHHRDCVELVKSLENESIDFTIFSPPFESLYTYSNSERDMGNCKSREEFHDHFGYLVNDLIRVTKSGRLVAFHCMNIPTSKSRDGFIGYVILEGN